LKYSAPYGFKTSLIANLAGNGWSALLQLICIPFYIRLMGIESYGLIGIYLILQTILQVLDIGLSPTMNREMARYSVHKEKMEEARDLVRTLEVGYWCTGVVIGLSLFAAVPWLSTHWIHAATLPRDRVRHALMFMAVLSVFQWPVSFYQGGLLGLHRQVLYNGIRILVISLSTGGAVLILRLISPTITAFLAWQMVVSLLQCVTLTIALWSSLGPAQQRPRFAPALIKGIWRFAAGMSGIAVFSLVLTQIDKAFVSKLLPLQTFGYYALASTAANSVLLVAGALFAVIFPRMSAQVAAGEQTALRHSYHTGSQLMAVLILPLATILSLFPYDVLRLWTRNSNVAFSAAPLLTILVIGSALNALLYLPYSLQLACGWTKLSLAAGLLSVAVVIPIIVPLTKRYGALGAAAVWAGLNILNMVITVPVMHRRLLRGEFWTYVRDVGLPFAIVLLIAGIAKILLAPVTTGLLSVLMILSAWLCCTCAAILASPQIRSWAVTQLRKEKPSYA
jgi:O-antigen/teichoic acid export membrane protein